MGLGEVSVQGPNAIPARNLYGPSALETRNPVWRLQKVELRSALARMSLCGSEAAVSDDPLLAMGHKTRK